VQTGIILKINGVLAVVAGIEFHIDRP